MNNRRILPPFELTELEKAVIGGPSKSPSERRMLAQMPGAYRAPKPEDPAEENKPANPLTSRTVNPKALAALTGGVRKSEDVEKGFPKDLAQKRKEEGDPSDPMSSPESVEKRREQKDESRKNQRKDKAMGLKRSLTSDELTVARLLKGHPQAEQLFEMLKGGVPENPPPKTDENFTDNDAEDFKEGLEEQDTIPDVEKSGPGKDLSKEDKEVVRESKKLPPLSKEDKKKSISIDEYTIARLFKGYPESFVEQVLEKANGGKPGTAGASGKVGENTPPNAGKRHNSGQDFADGSQDTVEEEGHADPGRPGTIKHEGGGTGPDHPGTATTKESQQKSYELDFSKSILERMGLEDVEKGVSKLRGNQAPRKDAWQRMGAREAAEEQKKEDVKHKVPRTRIFEEAKEVKALPGGMIRVRSAKSFDFDEACDAILKGRRANWDPKGASPKQDADEPGEADSATRLSGDPGSRIRMQEHREGLEKKWEEKKKDPKYMTPGERRLAGVPVHMKEDTKDEE